MNPDPMFWKLRVKLPSGAQYDVPVREIAMNRARYYAQKEHISLDASLAEDTIPLFKADSWEIIDWATNNMDWSDVQAHAVLVRTEHLVAAEQEAWMNGPKEVIKG